MEETNSRPKKSIIEQMLNGVACAGLIGIVSCTVPLMYNSYKLHEASNGTDKSGNLVFNELETQDYAKELRENTDFWKILSLFPIGLYGIGLIGTLVNDSVKSYRHSRDSKFARVQRKSGMLLYKWVLKYGGKPDGSEEIQKRLRARNKWIYETFPEYKKRDRSKR